MIIDNLQAENVFKPIPGNHPELVKNTTVSPYLYVGLLRMTFPNSKNYIGTATLIGKGTDDKESRYLLTCAHNLFSADNGGRATKVSFLRAYNDPDAPFEELEAEDWFYPSGYPEVDLPNEAPLKLFKEEFIQANIDLDYAIVKLKKAITLENSLPTLTVKNDVELHDKAVQINGYGYFYKNMSHATGPIKRAESLSLYYPISTRKGSSGSAIMDNDSLSIYGIHTRETDEELNRGVRITEAVKTKLLNWM